MNKLVIGCGYLGHRVAKSWLSDGDTVWALTRSSSRAEMFSIEGIRPVIGDVCEPATLVSLPSVETLLYAVGYDRASGRTQHEVSVEGVRNVLQAVAGRVRRFIYISSTSVYGQSDGEWVDELSDCHPVQPGGEFCLAAERLIEAFASDNDETRITHRTTREQAFTSNPCLHAQEKTRVNVLRFSGIYGPGRLLSRIESLRAGQVISGRGNAWLNLIHVDDGVAAVRACEDRGEAGRTYLITDDMPIHRADYYGLLAQWVNAPSPTFDPDVSSGRGSGGVNKRCRNRRMREELNVELKYPTIKEGVPQSLAAQE